MKTNPLRPQSVIFSLFGDYVRKRSRRIWIGSLVKLLSVLNLSEPSVRTTVSRMVKRGWLTNQRIEGKSYYALTPAAQSIIEDGASRIFNFDAQTDHWDGCWQLVTYGIPEEKRDARDRFRRELSWRGYGMLANAVWVSPRNGVKAIGELANKLGIEECVQIFSARLEGFIPCEEVVSRCWEMEKLNGEYASFIEKYEPLYCEFLQRGQEDESIGNCFARRLLLVHEYRRFPYMDPHLPRDLLPPDWHGQEAAMLFRNYHEALGPQANEFFDYVFR